MAKIKSIDLTDTQRQFCLEYIKDFNGTQAAIRAGYAANAAAQQASRLLNNANVQALIKLKTQKLEDKYDLSREAIAKRYAQLIHFDIRKLYDQEGNLIPIHELDEDTATALIGFEVDEQEDWLGKRSVTKKYKTSGIKEALDSASKFNGYNMPDKVEQSGKIETSVIIKRG